MHRSDAGDSSLGPPHSPWRGAATPAELRPRMSGRRALAWAAAAALLSALGLGLATSLGRPITLVLGPADHEYAQGFRRERKTGTALRWGKADARIELPFRVRRASRLLVTGARPGLAPAAIELRQDGGSTEVVDAGPWPADHALELVPARALAFSLRSRDAERNLSLQLSRVTILPAGAGAVMPEASVMVRIALGAAVLAATFLAAGFSGRLSLLASLGILAAPLCLVGLRDPFSAVHLARKASLFLPLLTALALLSRERARRIVPVVAVALAVRCAVFHPLYDYKDVEIHHQVTRVAARDGAAELWSRMADYQQRFDLGRASSGSGMVPFPYPPTFYAVAALLPLEDTEEAMKVVALAAQGLAVLLVMVVAGRLVGPGPPEVAAGLLAALFPLDLRELLRASYPALLGHAVDLSVVAWLSCRFRDLCFVRGTLVLAFTLAAAALTYNAAPVHFALFLPSLFLTASLRPTLPGRRGLTLAALGGALLSLAYYGSFVRSTWNRAMEGNALAQAQGLSATALEQALGRLEVGTLPYLFVPTVGAWFLLRRSWPCPESRVLLAWLLYPVLILVPVSLSPEPFRYFRQFYFAYPLFPLLGAALGAVRRGWVIPFTVALLAWSVYESVLVGRSFFLAVPRREPRRESTTPRRGAANEDQGSGEEKLTQASPGPHADRNHTQRDPGARPSSTRRRRIDLGRGAERDAPLAPRQHVRHRRASVAVRRTTTSAEAGASTRKRPSPPSRTKPSPSGALRSTAVVFTSPAPTR